MSSSRQDLQDESIQDPPNRHDVASTSPRGADRGEIPKSKTPKPKEDFTPFGEVDEAPLEATPSRRATHTDKKVQN